METLISLLTLLLSTHVSAGNFVRVAVIDTGLNLEDPRLSSHLCLSGHRDFTQEGLIDVNGHGTHVAGLIEKYAENSSYCLEIIKFYVVNDTDKLNTFRYTQAVDYAINSGATVVNISGGGHSRVEFEYQIISNNPNITFIVAAGNDGKNIDTLDGAFYPASYRLPNVIPVGNLMENGIPARDSNYGENVTWEYGTNIISTCPFNTYCKMSGTSQATAIKTGKFIHAKFN